VLDGAGKPENEGDVQKVLASISKNESGAKLLCDIGEKLQEFTKNTP
jgi:hypothetical protein